MCSYIDLQAILENRVKHVEGIKDSWILKEVSKWIISLENI